jgi:hypothetical protein
VESRRGTHTRRQHVVLAAAAESELGRLEPHVLFDAAKAHPSVTTFRGTRHATWYLSCNKDNKNGGLTVVLDANSGAVEKVLKN